MSDDAGGRISSEPIFSRLAWSVSKQIIDAHEQSSRQAVTERSYSRNMKPQVLNGKFPAMDMRMTKCRERFKSQKATTTELEEWQKYFAWEN